MIKTQNIDAHELDKIKEAVLNDQKQIKNLGDEIKKLEIEKKYIERRLLANSEKIKEA